MHRRLADWRLEREWERKGRIGPAPSWIKWGTLFSYAKRYGCTVFVETGTYLGDTVEEASHRFDHVYSIELRPDRVVAARHRFEDFPNVAILEGDSAAVLPILLPDLGIAKCLFWLDGHFGDATPILAELDAVLPFEGARVVLIDDARDFGRLPAYPTLDIVRERAEQQGFSFEVEHDIMRLVRL
jgi:hypothetical protein